MKHLHITVTEAALWRCGACGAWWCSQPARQETQFLLQMPAAVLESLGWSNFRGWRLGVMDTTVCSDCHSLVEHPLYTAQDVAPRSAPLTLPVAARSHRHSVAPLGR